MTGKEVVNYRGLKALGIPYSRTHIGRLIVSSDFPKPFKLGSHRNSPPVFWLKEIIDWLDAKANAGAPK